MAKGSKLIVHYRSEKGYSNDGNAWNSWARVNTPSKDITGWLANEGDVFTLQTQSGLKQQWRRVAEPLPVPVMWIKTSYGNYWRVMHAVDTSWPERQEAAKNLPGTKLTFTPDDWSPASLVEMVYQIEEPK